MQVLYLEPCGIWKKMVSLINSKLVKKATEAPKMMGNTSKLGNIRLKWAYDGWLMGKYVDQWSLWWLHYVEICSKSAPPSSAKNGVWVGIPPFLRALLQMSKSFGQLFFATKHLPRRAAEILPFRALEKKPTEKSCIDDVGYQQKNPEKWIRRKKKTLSNHPIPKWKHRFIGFNLHG